MYVFFSKPANNAITNHFITNKKYGKPELKISLIQLNLN